MNPPDPTETLVDVVTDRYEADCLATVAQRMHDRLIGVGWELPATQFYVTQEGSTFTPHYMMVHPVLHMDSFRRTFGEDADPDQAILHLPMTDEPHDLPPFAGLLTSAEYWGVKGFPDDPSAGREVLHPIWHGNIEMHPDREDGRRTQWCTPDGKGGEIRQRRSGDKVLKDEPAALLSAVAVGIERLRREGRQFRSTQWRLVPPTECC